jgi:sec-independent protein translocase protein TatB
MFEVGFTELLLIFGLALIVLGPEKLPKLAQQVGRWVGRARAMARQFRDQLEEEAHNLETKINIDPGIDTSLEPKPKKPTPAAGAASAGTEVVPAAAPESAPEEEFYPPDHHMHPAQRAATEAAPEQAGLQSELDLTTSRDPDPRAGP